MRSLIRGMVSIAVLGLCYLITVNPTLTQTVVVTGLTMPNTYTFAVKGVDYLGNVSDVSNFPAGSKVDWKVQEVPGINAGGTFGNTVVVGDFNCDGYSDVAVGEPTAASNVGRVYLYFGTGAGLLTTPKMLKGTLASGLFGTRLAALNFAGNTSNNHPCTDLAVLAFWQDNYKGRVYLYLGKPLWLQDREDETPGIGAEVIYKLPSTAADTEQLGVRVGKADLDGDKLDDLAMLYRNSATSTATLLIDYGDKTIPYMAGSNSSVVRTMPDAAKIQVTGGSYSGFFGYAMANGGLINADTYGDLLVGAGDQVVGGTKVGSAYIILGGARSTGTPPEVLDLTTSTSRVIRIDGASTNIGFGWAVAGLGDINGDGTAEFAIGDYKKTAGTSTLAGEAYIFNLASTIPSTALDAKAVIANDLSPNESNALGRSLANGADVDPLKGVDLNGDHYADTCIGLTRTGAVVGGSVKLFYGKSSFASTMLSAADYSFAPAAASTGYSLSMAYLDVNGDGFIDLMVGDGAYSSSLGRFFIYY